MCSETTMPAMPQRVPKAKQIGGVATRGSCSLQAAEEQVEKGKRGKEATEQRTPSAAEEASCTPPAALPKHVEESFTANRRSTSPPLPPPAY